MSGLASSREPYIYIYTHASRLEKETMERDKGLKGLTRAGVLDRIRPIRRTSRLVAVFSTLGRSQGPSLYAAREAQ